MTHPTIQRYLFRDKFTGEIFPVESSFCIWNQALYRSPKFIMAKVEHAMGLGGCPEDRFEVVEDPARDGESP